MDTTQLRTPPFLALYVHFPWCVAKCPYCDFNSHPLRGDLLQDDYLDALLKDFSEQIDKRPNTRFSTVFLGGGTPSLFSPAAFAELLEAIEPWLTDDAEITMEANPGSQEHWDFAGYHSAGINRLSIGAQSFDPAQLKQLGRIHVAADTERAFRLARDAGFDNINLDLMYALPGQTSTDAMADLKKAFSLKPDHLSWYQLTIEAKTEFAKRPPLLPHEDSVEQMETLGHAALAEAGYARYETSAYAREGKRCQHNRTYWRFGDYLGIGAGAQGKLTTADRVVRTSKPSQPRLYLNNPTRTDELKVATEDLPAEFAMNALRLVEGIDDDQLDECLSQLHLSQAVAAQATTQLRQVWQKQIDLGLMRSDRFALTERGANYLDTVTAAFLA